MPKTRNNRSRFSVALHFTIPPRKKSPVSGIYDESRGVSPVAGTGGMASADISGGLYPSIGVRLTYTTRRGYC